MIPQKKNKIYTYKQKEREKKRKKVVVSITHFCVRDAVKIVLLFFA